MAALLVSGGLLSLASSVDDDDGWEPRETIEVDATWMVSNLYDGQTAVPVNRNIQLTVGTRDFAGDPAPTLSMIRFYEADSGEPVDFDVSVGFATSSVTVSGGLMPDTDYILDLGSLRNATRTRRSVPDPIHFSTRSAPQVIDLWRNEDTLIIEFSEPMDSETLFVGQTSVDLLWEENGEIRSLAADTNIASYIWETRGTLFLLAPIDFPEVQFSSYWIKIAGRVQSDEGTPLDGDGNGRPGETSDDYVWEFIPYVLETCYTREDIPHPCIREQEIPEPWML
jgi:hypothetical protein